MITMASLGSSGTSYLFDIGLEGVAVDGAIEHPGAMMRCVVRVATPLVVFQWP